MGTTNSKKKSRPSEDVAPKASPPKKFEPIELKEGDIINRAMMKFCFDKSTSHMKTAFDSGIDMISPYNGAPLIFSMVLASITSGSSLTSGQMWDMIKEKMEGKVLILSEITVNATLRTLGDGSGKTAFIHIGDLDMSIMSQPSYRAFKYKYNTIPMYRSTNVTLKNMMYMVMTCVKQTFLKLDGGIDGRDLPISEIVSSCKNIIDDTNSIQYDSDGILNTESYYEKYHKKYTMKEVIPIAVQVEPVKISTDLPEAVPVST